MTIWKAFLLTIFYVVSCGVIQIGLLSLRFLIDFENEFYLILSELSIIVSIIFSFFIFDRIFIKEKFFDKKDLKNIKSGQINLLIFIAVGLFLFDKILFDGYHYIFIDNFKIEKIIAKSHQLDYHLIIYLISPLILAPILEELVFRKYIFSKLLEKNSLILSVLISSFCFSLIHLPNYRNLLPTFIFGLIAAYLFYKSRNIIYPIILHFFGNSIWAIFKFYDSSLHQNFQKIKFDYLYWMISISGFVLVLISMKFFIKNEKKAET